MTSRLSILVAAGCLAAALAGCDRPAPGTAPAEAPAQAASPDEAATSPAGGRVRGHGETEAAATPALPTEPPLTERVAVGAEAPEGLEVVDAAEVLRNPEQYRGKNVSVRGTVKGFCHHARAWFAIDAPGASPPYLRLLTRPAFAVPRGVMGARATSHGTVEVVELPRERVQHFEEEHRLGTGSDDPESETAVRVVIRAAGATFEPAAAEPAASEPAAE